MIPLFQSPAVGFEMVTSFSSLLQLLLVALDVSSFPDSVQVKSEDLENLLDRCKRSWKMAVKWFGVYVCECFCCVRSISICATIRVQASSAGLFAFCLWFLFTHSTLGCRWCSSTMTATTSISTPFATAMKVDCCDL